MIDQNSYYQEGLPDSKALRAFSNPKPNKNYSIINYLESNHNYSLQNESFIGLVNDTSYLDKSIDNTDRNENNKSECLTNDDLTDSGRLNTPSNPPKNFKLSNFSANLTKTSVSKDEQILLAQIHTEDQIIFTENAQSTLDQPTPEVAPNDFEYKNRKRTVSFGLSQTFHSTDNCNSPPKKTGVPSFSILKNSSKNAFKHSKSFGLEEDENRDSEVDTPQNQHQNFSPPLTRLQRNLSASYPPVEDSEDNDQPAQNPTSLDHTNQEARRQNQNNEEVREVRLNVQQSENNNQVTQNEQSIEEKRKQLNKILGQAANFKVRRAVVLCFSIFIGSILAFPLVDGGSSWLRGIFIVCEIFLGYYLIENIIKFFRKDILPWKKFENLFDLLDVVNLILFAVGIDLRLSGVPIITKYIPIIPLLCAIVYFWKSRAPKAIKEAQTTLRLLMALQMLLLAGRADGNLIWAWKALMSFLWLYTGLLSLYSLLVGITLICVIVMAFFGMRLYENVNLSSQIVGFLWSTFYSGLGTVGLLCLIGITLAYDSNQAKDLLTSAMLLGQYLSLAIGIFSISAYHWIFNFLLKFNMDEVDYRTQLGLAESADSQVVTEKKETYLVMLSSTYFLSLKNSFFTSKDKIRRLKRAIRESKKNKNKASKFNDIASKVSKLRPLTVQELKNEKAGLDELVAKGSGFYPDIAANNVKRPRGFSMGVVNLAPQVYKRERKESTVSNGQGDIKVCLSEGDRTVVFDSPLQTSKQKGDAEDLCYICYSQSPNAVIQECGHGGICSDCAIQTIKAKGQCMECRAEVKHVIKIQVDPKLKNIIKGYETITITPDKPNQEQ